MLASIEMKSLKISGNSRRWFSDGSASSFDAGDDQQIGEQKQRPFFSRSLIRGDGDQIVADKRSATKTDEWIQTDLFVFIAISIATRIGIGNRYGVHV